MKTAHTMFLKTFLNLSGTVPEEMIHAFWLYMCYGIEPGSFGMALLQNSFIDAVIRAHPAITSGSFKALAEWLRFCAPFPAHGSCERVEEWKRLTDDERKEIMIEYGLRPSVIQVLKGEEVA
jgi:hypothetical protein